MKSIALHDVLPELCRATKRWGMYYGGSFNDQPLQEVKKAAPWMTPSQYVDGTGWLLFNSELEMLAVYHLTVGDDGPTPLNPYNGPAKVYAATCGPDGKLRSENT